MIQRIVHHDLYPVVSGVVGLVAATAVMRYIFENRIGPRVMWASDLCPEADVVCGVIPLGTVVAAVVGAVVAAVLLGPWVAVSDGEER